MLQLPWENHKYILSRHDNSIHPGYLGLRLTGGAAQILKIQFLRDLRALIWHPGRDYDTKLLNTIPIFNTELRQFYFFMWKLIPCGGLIFKNVVKWHPVRDIFSKLCSIYTLWGTIFLNVVKRYPVRDCLRWKRIPLRAARPASS